ncbi:MAG TPA: NAD-dependent epimerase/dehydratase family protein, partial [Solirubrobacterales bacterium]|nr:NAD-dependent epimerase/dehydratase family protein [Solirubrobacterales bacterium]
LPGLDASAGGEPGAAAVGSGSGAAAGGAPYDAVFHLAAQTLVGPAMADPVATFEANVAAGWQVLEACRSAGVPRVILASSDKAYGTAEQLPYREGMPLSPGSPYEASKAAIDLIAQSYARAYDLPVAITRFANIYGGGDLNFSRLVPEAIAAAIQGRRSVIRSDGSPERDFLHIDDAIAAYLALDQALADRGDSGNRGDGGGASGSGDRASGGGAVAGLAFNAGSGRSHSVRKVLDLIAAASGSELEPDFRGEGNPAGEIDRQYVDAGRLTALTGWQPQWSLADGLAETHRWYAAHPEILPRNT